MRKQKSSSMHPGMRGTIIGKTIEMGISRDHY